MRIGFDAKRYFQNATGLGNYSRSLVHALARMFPEDEFVLFSTSEHEKNFAEENIRISSSNTNFKSIWRSFSIKKNILEEKLDVYHGLSNEIPFGIQKLPVKTIVTIHDLIFKIFPRQYPLIDRTFYHLKSENACKHADVVIAASAATKKDIQNYYQIPENNIQVVYQSCNEIFHADYPKESISEILKLHTMPAEYFLYVGSFSERKNLLALLEAYSKINPHKRIPLVLVGNGISYEKQINRFLFSHQLEKFVFIKHTIPTSHLPMLYHGAACFIYPSLYEGFGIPILEAMSCNCPVLTSNSSSMPEVGGDAAMYFHPQNIDEIIFSIETFLNHSGLRKTMVEKGKEQANKFSPASQAEQIHHLYTS